MCLDRVEWRPAYAIRFRQNYTLQVSVVQYWEKECLDNCLYNDLAIFVLAKTFIGYYCPELLNKRDL